MPNYQKMYALLFNAVTDAVQMLQQAQQQTEEIYISGDDPIIRIMPQNGCAENEDSDCQE